MNIGAFESCTLLDYPGKIACIVYTVGCNFRCKYCYNPDIISDENFKASGRKLIPEEEVLDYIQKHMDMLDAVCITGGEPTMQSDLLEFCKKIKNLNKLVKIDTNGGHPERLQACISAGVVDFIAMDIKGPMNRYSEITGFVNLPAIKESIMIVKNSGIPHEFRLTLYPELKKEDIIDTISLVPGDLIYLQQFEPEHAYSAGAREMKPINKDVINEIVEETKHIADVRIRGF